MVDCTTNAGFLRLCQKNPKRFINTPISVFVIESTESIDPSKKIPMKWSNNIKDIANIDHSMPMS